MEKSIFNQYDIRGQYPKEIDETVVYRLGLRLGEMIAGETAVVGTDIRENSQKLVEPLAAGLEKSGKKVLFLGVVATEMVYFAVAARHLNLGIQITASHDPWDQTGFKIIGAKAISFSINGNLVKLEQLFQKSVEKYEGQKPQNLEKIDLSEAYAYFTADLLGEAEGLSGKLLIVSFGEAGGNLAQKFFSKTKVAAKIVVFNKDKLGDLAPNPLLLENQEMAMKEVDPSFDLVVMLDGDSDRTIFINPKTREVLGADLSAALIAQAILEQTKGPIVFDVRKKMVMQQTCQDFQVPFYQVISGYPNIKHKMMEEQAVFGGEASGHYFYPKNFYCENSMLSTALILQYLKKHQVDLSAALAEFSQKVFSIPEENFTLNDSTNFDWQKLKQDLENRLPNSQIKSEDGIIVENPDFYLDLRLSQTEALLRLNIEARSQEILDLVHEQVKALLKN
jgi:phosphomannomutase